LGRDSISLLNHDPVFFLLNIAKSNELMQEAQNAHPTVGCAFVHEETMTFLLFLKPPHPRGTRATSPAGRGWLISV